MQEVMEQFQQAMLQKQLQQVREQARQAGDAGQTQRQQMLQQQVRQMEQVIERREQAPANLQQAQQFLEQNRQEPDVHVTDSGLQYQVIEEGEGESPDASDTVKVHYRGTLLDGTEFDSSYARGQPATFAVNQVVPGWTEALQEMKVGGTWKLWIPPDLGYGAQGRGPVPPNALMVFEVELIDIVDAQ
jgi:FKBP-type peptidyl-prolyl cis-trans isomerase